MKAGRRASPGRVSGGWTPTIILGLSRPTPQAKGGTSPKTVGKPPGLHCWRARRTKSTPSRSCCACRLAGSRRDHRCHGLPQGHRRTGPGSGRGLPARPQGQSSAPARGCPAPLCRRGHAGVRLGPRPSKRTTGASKHAVARCCLPRRCGRCVGWPRGRACKAWPAWKAAASRRRVDLKASVEIVRHQTSTFAGILCWYIAVRGQAYLFRLLNL